MTKSGFDLDEIERLLAAATPGEWVIWFEQINGQADKAIQELIEQVHATHPIGNSLVMLNADGKCPAITGCGPTSANNAALIVALHNSAPAMLTEIRELRAENARLKEDLADSYVKLSGVSDHASDCATSSAPAITPGPCDCAVADSVRSRRINGLEAIRDVNPAIASVALLQEIARAALGEPQ